MCYVDDSNVRDEPYFACKDTVDCKQHENELGWNGEPDRIDYLGRNQTGALVDGSTRFGKNSTGALVAGFTGCSTTLHRVNMHGAETAIPVTVAANRQITQINSVLFLNISTS